jgi:hypothetical protein
MARLAAFVGHAVVLRAAIRVALRMAILVAVFVAIFVPARRVIDDELVLRTINSASRVDDFC